MEICSWTGFYFCCFVPQEKLECSKRSWELQQLQRLKEEEQQQHMMEGDEDLFTYTREDAYNMVGGTVWSLLIKQEVVRGLLCCSWPEPFLCTSTGVCVWCGGWPHRNYAGKMPHVTLSVNVYTDSWMMQTPVSLPHSMYLHWATTWNPIFAFGRFLTCGFPP